MTETVRRLLQEAMKLSAPERAALVDELAATLPADLSEGDPEWLAEIDRRVEQALSGEAPGSPWSEVKARLEARLNRDT